MAYGPADFPELVSGVTNVPVLAVVQLKSLWAPGLGFLTEDTDLGSAHLTQIFGY